MTEHFNICILIICGLDFWKVEIAWPLIIYGINGWIKKAYAYGKSIFWLWNSAVLLMDFSTSQLHVKNIIKRYRRYNGIKSGLILKLSKQILKWNTWCLMFYLKVDRNMGTRSRIQDIDNLSKITQTVGLVAVELELRQWDRLMLDK